MDLTTLSGITSYIDVLSNAMTEDEYRKAEKFYDFLLGLTKCTGGVLSIDRESFVMLASSFMKCSPGEAVKIIMKMKDYGWIRAWDDRFIVVDERRRDRLYYDILRA